MGVVKMGVCYNKLFKLLIDKKMTNTELAEKAGFSANIITRLKRDKYVSLDSIEKICGVLGFGVDEILEFIPDSTIDKRHKRKDVTF
jgi:DNA-binding Xre family transcriptional regulator